MPSIVTGIIGGIQGASAAKNAAKAQQEGYRNAAGTVNTAVQNANPILSQAASTAGAGVTNAATTAGTGVVNAAGTAGADVTKAAGDAASGVSAAAGDANAMLNPYFSMGGTAAGQLQNLTAAGGFHFDPSDLEKTPGYQFTLEQGLKGLNASGATAGNLQSGAAQKEALRYATGLADTTYNERYQQALQAYNANLSTLFPQVQMGMGAAGQAGGNLMNAAQYGGTAGLNAAQWAGGTNVGAAQYAGNAGQNAAQYAGNAGMWSGGQQASNLINAGLYTGNTQIQSGNSAAQGMMNSANAWNGMLNGIGTAGNQILMGGFAPGGGGGWSLNNLGTNFGNLWGAGGYGYGGGGMNPAPSWSAMPSYSQMPIAQLYPQAA